MATFDLYSSVHKGLRTLLYGAATRIARTDFDDDGQARAATAELRRTLGFLHEHAEHEDREILPLLREKNPWTAEEFQGDHARLEGLHRDIEALLSRIDTTNGAEREALGRRLAERANRLVAEHIHHMEREERSGNRVLWAHCSDDELHAAHERIVTSIGLERLTQWAEFLLPALNRAEREQAIAGISAIVPAAVLAVIGTASTEVQT